MRYLLAIVLPPVAMFTCGKPFQALICLILQVTVFGWIPAAIWALLTVSSYQADKRNERLIKAMQQQRS
jgi:uncharacterized membrane protein YqaE (UPF0057 family)